VIHGGTLLPGRGRRTSGLDGGGKMKLVSGWRKKTDGFLVLGPRGRGLPVRRRRPGGRMCGAEEGPMFVIGSLGRRGTKDS